MKLFTLLAAASACVVAVPATAAVTMNTYNIAFTAGTVNAVPTVRTTVGEYQDTFVFNLDTAGTFSGSLSTQRLRNANGVIVSDIDFGNSIDGVALDGVRFDDPVTGQDALEVANLASTFLSAGSHSLVVNYTVLAASRNNGATYTGPLFFASTGAVPEPASWAMFIGGFGLVGAGMRRRRTSVSFAA